jgi:hypothetical protein
MESHTQAEIGFPQTKDRTRSKDQTRSNDRTRSEDGVEAPKSTLETPFGTLDTGEIDVGNWEAKHIAFDRVTENPNSYYVVRRELGGRHLYQNYCGGKEEAIKFDSVHRAQEMADSLNNR